MIFEVVREMLGHGVSDDIVDAEVMVRAELRLNFNVHDCYTMIAFMVGNLEIL